MKYILWVDDLRNPNITRYNPLIDWHLLLQDLKEKYSDATVVWCKNYKEFATCIDNNGIPVALGFDHDLGKDMDGYDCAKYLVEYCIKQDIDIPYYVIQSANPTGAQNIRGLLNNYQNFRKQWATTH